MKFYDVIAKRYNVNKKERVEFVVGTFYSISNAMLFKDAYEKSMQSTCTINEYDVNEDFV